MLPQAWWHQGLTFVLSHLKAAPQTPSFTILARCTEFNIKGNLLELELFDAFVRPVISYSKFWALLASNAAFLCIERVHVGILRRLFGAPHRSPVQVQILGRLMCTVPWWSQALLYMSYLHKCDEEGLVSLLC